MADDKRWMIRGVDREIRKAVKSAARTEGISVGGWVRRALERALDVAAKGPATVADLNERVHLLEAQLSVLEGSHRALHRKVHSAARPQTGIRKQRSWAPTKKSK